MPLLQSAINDANTKHSNVQKNELTNKYKSIKDKLNELKLVTDTANSTLARLRSSQQTNKQLVENKVNEVQNLLNTTKIKANDAITSKESSKLEETLNNIEEVITKSNKAKTLTQEKHYSSKTNEVDNILSQLNTLKSNVTKALEDAKTEAERIARIKQEVEKMLTDLDNAINKVKENHATLDSLEADIKKLEDLLINAEKLKKETESSSKLDVEKQKLTDKITKAKDELAKAREKNKNY
ncbi:hypothetical protein [Metamycoplasma buccale]|uniref:hypothetical protein n=1 Tax=Metamycoplasma buccale TaxID=55602 RepID=UPI00398E685A